MSHESQNSSCQFRINAKSFALTYSNPVAQSWVPFTTTGLLEHLCSLSPTSYCVVSLEVHQDGNPHFHAVVTFKCRKDLRNARYFDYNNVHPNITAVRSLPAAIAYVKKYDDFVETQGTSSSGENCDDLVLLAASKSEPEWFSYCLKNKIPFPYAEKFWKFAHPVQDQTIESMPEGGLISDPGLQVMNLDHSVFKSKCVVVVGPTGVGKTTWALKNAEFPVLLVTHMDALRQFKPDYHKTIIFDDMSFQHMPREGQIHLVDQYMPRSIHARYNIVSIPAGTKKIFTANNPPFTDDPAINRRIYSINLN